MKSKTSTPKNMCDDYSKIQNKTNAVCSLLARAIVCKFANTIQHQVNNLFSDGVVSACEVIGCIFFSTNQLLRMEQLAVRTSANFINHLVSRTHRERTLPKHGKYGYTMCSQSKAANNNNNNRSQGKQTDTHKK